MLVKFRALDVSSGEEKLHFWHIKLNGWLVSAINLISSSYVGEMYAGNLTSKIQDLIIGGSS